MPDISSLYPIITIVIAMAIIGVGLVGTIYPVLPGPTLMLGGFWLLAWNDDYTNVGGLTLGLLLFLTAVSLITDFIASALGAKRAGASTLAIFGALLGSIIGIFFGIPGLIIGPFVGAMAGELTARGGVQQSATVGLATWVGVLLGTVAKLAIGITMLGIFVVAWFIL